MNLAFLNNELFSKTHHFYYWNRKIQFWYLKLLSAIHSLPYLIIVTILFHLKHVFYLNLSFNQSFRKTLLVIFHHLSSSSSSLLRSVFSDTVFSHGSFLFWAVWTQFILTLFRSPVQPVRAFPLRLLSVNILLICLPSFILATWPAQFRFNLEIR